MKTLFTLIAILTALSSLSVAAETFCLSASDTSTSGSASTSRHTVSEDFNTYYVFRDTDSDHKAIVKLYVNDNLEETWTTGCGCGTESFTHNTDADDVIYFTVECVDCSIFQSGPGSVSVWIYSPSPSSCPPDCQPK